MAVSSVEAARPAELFLPAYRPWFALYGLRLRRREEPSGPQGRVLALPDGILLHILGLCEPSGLACALCTCRGWSRLARTPQLWERACQGAWRASGLAGNAELCARRYDGDWFRMYRERPRVRTDGVYVSRNTYIRLGVVHWDVRNPVHLVAYYRYLRFFQDGTFAYKTTPTTVNKVARLLREKPRGKARAAGLTNGGDERVITGRYYLSKDKVYTSFMYEGSQNTEIRSQLRVRSKHPGANDRLDIKLLMSYNRTDQEYQDIMETPTEDDVVTEKYNKGMNTYVFIPWHRVDGHELNLPIEELDFYIPG